MIEEEQNHIHENVFYFSDKKAYHLMTHRTDLEWVDISKPFVEIKEQIEAARHNKVICCDQSLDNFVGVLNLTDYFKALGRKKSVDIRLLMKEPVVLPEKADAYRVLDELRKSNNRVCFIVNEYGGFEGIVTLYDVMDNIVGDLPETGESNEPDMIVRDDNSVLVNGDAPVEILADIVDGLVIDFNEIDYSTVAGFVLSQLNRIPRSGEKFNYLDYTFEIMDMDGNRVDKILVYRLD